MFGKSNRRDKSLSRQRFTFTLCGEFPRERELLAHLFELPSGRTGAAALQMIMLGFETTGKTTQAELDDNFPWLPAKDYQLSSEKKSIDSMSNVFFKCQFSLYPHVAEHSRLISMMSSLTNERRADVLRRLSLRGIRIYSIGKKLAIDGSVETYTGSNLEKRIKVSEKKHEIYPLHPLDRVMEIKKTEKISDAEFQEAQPKSTVQENIKKASETIKTGDNKVRAKSFVFRKSPESLISFEEKSESVDNFEKPKDKYFSEETGIIDEDIDGQNRESGHTSIIRGSPVQERKNDIGSKNGLAGLAAMMGGFAGMDND